MSYYDTSLITVDQDIRLRCTACASLESIPDPEAWVWARIWQYAAQPEWGAAYASALAAGNPAPGRDPAVITDGMILAATNQMNGGELSS